MNYENIKCLYFRARISKIRIARREEKLAFSDLVDIFNKELTRQRLEKSVELAKQYGLSEISMEDISNEVNELRTGYEGGRK